MQRQRGLFLGLVLSALLGLMGNQAQAGAIMFSVDLDGVVVYGPVSTVDLTALNNDLRTAGSAFRFSSLSATSNFTGAATGFLQTTGQISIAAVGTTAASLSVDTTQSGFLSPVGPSGTLASTASGSYITMAGSTTYTSDFQGTNATPQSFTQSGSGSFSTVNPPPTVPTGSVPSGYSLSNHFVIAVSGPVGSTEGFSGQALITAAAIPEPSSIVMFLTGMPMPLAIVLGVLRRRRARS